MKSHRHLVSSAGSREAPLIPPTIAANARAGMTLIELVIAMTILAILLVAVGEAIVSTLEMSAAERVGDDLARDALEIQRIISTDLAQSGWHAASGDDGDYRTDQTSVDRALVYYPFVIQQAPAGQAAGTTLGAGLPLATLAHDDLESGEDLTHFIRTPAMVELIDPATGVANDGYPVVLPGAASEFAEHFHSDAASSEERRHRYYRSYYARSQEMVFLKAQVGSWSADPIDQEVMQIDFSGTADEWSNPGNHTALAVEPFGNWELDLVSLSGDGHEARINDLDQRGLMVPGAWASSLTSGGAIEIKPRWESRRPQPRVYDAATDQRMRQADLREYAYCVVPSPYGLGALVRTYSVDLSVDLDPVADGDQTFPDRGPGIRPGHYIARHGDLVQVVDDVLSDNVVRVVFDTVRTVGDGSLALNDIRVRVYLAKRSARDPDIVYRRTVEMVASLRTANDPDRNREMSAVFATEDLEFPY